MVNRRSKATGEQSALPVARQSIRRDEVVSIETFMGEFGIKDIRTAIRILKALGLPTSRVGGIKGKIFVSGEAFCESVKNAGVVNLG